MNVKYKEMAQSYKNNLRKANAQNQLRFMQSNQMRMYLYLKYLTILTYYSIYVHFFNAKNREIQKLENEDHHI